MDIEPLLRHVHLPFGQEVKQLPLDQLIEESSRVSGSSVLCSLCHSKEPEHVIGQSLLLRFSKQVQQAFRTL